jgi:hypothetical protein
LGHVPPGEEIAFLQRIHRALKRGGRFVFYSAYGPFLLAPRNLALRTFNGIMRLRNALLKPPFIMYYFNFLLPEVAARLKAEGFEVAIRPEPCGRYRLVTATKL